ncbi:MAG TPA: guanylate kinase [Steroidobacteraceae bacterium]|nr:guanylate kinase [Steroidobacteraceae bacterium]
MRPQHELEAGDPASAHQETSHAGGGNPPAAVPRERDSRGHSPPDRDTPLSGQGRLYVVAAPSGAGKTSLVKALMEREPRMRFSVSYTTRPPRPNEVDGQDYHFVTQARFEEMAARGEFLEHARVFDNFYGTGLQAVQSELRDGHLLLLEIDWQGARQVRTRLPAARSIFILPPTRRALEERLRARSTDSEAVIERRLRDAAQDLAHWTEFDYVVVNDQFERAVADLVAIVHLRGEEFAATRPEVARFAAGLLNTRLDC